VKDGLVGINPDGKAGSFIEKSLYQKKRKDLRKDILLLSPKA
jgi:hypothetical protein